MPVPRHALPHAPPGHRIGLFGGSFDPPHAGHVALSRMARRVLGLDQVWWLVSPGNPLKPHGPAPLAQRIERARAMTAADPHVRITGIEARLGTRHTAQTLRALLPLYPRAQFVWLMGADCMVGLHRWGAWRDILAMLPVAVLARPGQGLAALNAVAARSHARFRVPPARARGLAGALPPAWVFLQMPMVRESSSRIRASARQLRA